MEKNSATLNTIQREWWKEAIIYQIYPRSFKDGNGDGIGDLNGIITKLPYLKALGVDVLWLSPCFKSPNADNGYDVSDYEDIMDEFGTMADFDNLLHGVHELGMKLILDLVVNHSSDEHRWFKEARKSKDNPYREFYIWRDEPNDWISFFSGSAWTLDPLTRQYYLHLFVAKQPDLNWENPALRQEIYKMMRFWLDKGVDGFRMDVIPFLSKDTTFADFPEGRKNDLTYYANGPKIHEYLQEMNAEVLSRYDCLTVGEGFGVNAGQANLYVGKNRHELQMIYHFDHAVPRAEEHFITPAPEFNVVQLKAIFSKWDTALGDDGWQNIYWGNHDNPRVLSRFGDVGTYRIESAKLLATLLFTLRGTPSIYQGDELGMTNCPFENIEEYDDIQVKNAYQSLVFGQKKEASTFIKACNQIARDHARTPMQWTDAENAGFTAGKTSWLKLNPNYRHINAAQAQNDPNSVYHYCRTLIQFRKENPVLVYGNYEDLLPDDPYLWAFRRSLEDFSLMIVANFCGEIQPFPLLSPGERTSLLMGNYKEEGIKDALRPYEVRVLSCWE
jgi:oligo-1,6-glucosidase